MKRDIYTLGREHAPTETAIIQLKGLDLYHPILYYLADVRIFPASNSCIQFMRNYDADFDF